MMLSTKDEARVHGLSRLEQDPVRQRAATSTSLVRLGENLDYYDGETP